MRIERGQLIAGFPAIGIRNMFRRLYNVIHEDNIVELLGTSKVRAKLLLKELVQAGYLERKIDHLRRKYYSTTPLAMRLKNASAAAPVPRSKADQMLLDLRNRAEMVNLDPDYTWRVSKLVVFGSYLDKSKDKLGDVDVMVKLDRKPGGSQELDDEKSKNDPLFRGGGIFAWLSW